MMILPLPLQLEFKFALLILILKDMVLVNIMAQALIHGMSLSAYRCYHKHTRNVVVTTQCIDKINTFIHLIRIDILLARTF